MRISLKGKGIIKKVALALAGVAALGLIAWGIKAIVDYTKNDLKKITLTYDVGNLGSDGKYVNDESTLYTKEAFGCYGLQVKPDFDSTVNYQIFYYDILDNYISSTAFMSDGYSGEAPVNGAYARIVIEPREDEDGKISWTERIKYPSQLTVKVKKNQDVDNRFVVYKGRVMQVVNDIADVFFENKLTLDNASLEWVEADNFCVTASTVLKVVGGSTITCDFSSLGKDEHTASCRVYEFTDLPKVENYVGCISDISPYLLNKQTKYIIISAYCSEGWVNSELTNLPSCFSITKTK